MTSTRKDYQVIAAEKAAQRNSKIPEDWRITREPFNSATNLLQVPTTCGVLSDIECDITSNYDATALLVKLRAGEFSAEQVTIAFCKRAAIAQQLVGRTAPFRHHKS